MELQEALQNPQMTQHLKIIKITGTAHTASRDIEFNFEHIINNEIDMYYQAEIAAMNHIGEECTVDFEIENYPKTYEELPFEVYVIESQEAEAY